MDIEALRRDTHTAANALLDAANLDPGDIFVVGCSTSEVLGEHIGSAGSTEVATALFNVLHDAARRHHVHLAVQCCEHLNRAVVLTRAAAKNHLLSRVSVVPHPHAGGALAAVAYRALPDPVVVSQVAAGAGMDIGDVLIGMQLQPVAVPFRHEVKTLGGAHLNMATTRPPLIGGERAKYVV